MLLGEKKWQIFPEIAQEQYRLLICILESKLLASLRVLTRLQWQAITHFTIKVWGLCRLNVELPWRSTQGPHRPSTPHSCPKVKLCKCLHKCQSQVQFALATVSRGRWDSGDSANIVLPSHLPLGSARLQRYQFCYEHCSCHIKPLIWL